MENKEIEKAFPESKNIQMTSLSHEKTKIKIIFTAEEMKIIRNWILDLQEEFCSPKSYINSSSRTIIINQPQYGNVPMIFSWTQKTFDLVISCCKEFEDAKKNIEIFNMEKYCNFYNGEYQDYLEKEYLQKSPNSIIFLDFINSEMNLPMKTLIDLALNKCKAPLLILLLNLDVIIDNNSDIEILSCKDEIFKKYKFKLVALKLNKSMNNNELYYPSVNTLNQFKSLYKNKKLIPNFEKFFHNKIRNKNLSNKSLNLLEDLLYENRNDKYIYNELNHYIFKNGFKLETETRIDYRIIEIQEFLKDFEKKIERNLSDLLDVGCAEGSITYKIGEIFLKDPTIDHIFGCDVREIKDNNNFQFQLLKDDKLPYIDEKFSIVTCLMTLHHIKNVDLMIEEIYRVLKPGSWFLIREHSCIPPEYGLFLDIMHGLYALVLTTPQEWPDFCETYYAKYLSENEWKEKIEKVGFRLVKSTKPQGNMNWYYSLFQKPSKRKEFE